ncbi:MAG: hypothetical protein Q8P67_11150 [archaeon]|nr:hypothetical protein [archaeon]
MASAPDFKPVHASAPGKVLISGGYQILHRPLPGLVFTTDCRFHADCGEVEHGASRPVVAAPWAIRVVSEQLGEESLFCVHSTEERLKVALISGPHNPFVIQALTCALAAVGPEVLAVFLKRFINSSSSSSLESPTLGSEPPPCLLVVRVRGDNAFYVQHHNLTRLGLPQSPESLQKLPPFQPVARDEHGSLQKTGLGSSAALTVSVVAAVASFLWQHRAPDGWQQTVYQAAQVAHCAAQGKIGSGFDVSAAVFGSHRYVRFSPALIEPLLQKLADGTLRCPGDFLDAAQWDDERVPVRFPASLKLVLADVNAGSNTPSMVRKVLDGLRDRADQTAPVWRELTASNVAFEQQLHLLAESAASPAPSVSQRDALRVAYQKSRGLLRTLGQLCDVPIEPPEQTLLLDSTLQLPGAVFAGVPGAGGFDAIFAAVHDDPSALADIDRHWASFPTSVWRLAVSQDDRGLVVEEQAKTSEN